jgi:hypothetical protein
MVLAGPRVSVAPASDAIDGAASDTAASPSLSRALPITFRPILRLAVGNIEEALDSIVIERVFTMRADGSTKVVDSQKYWA